MACSRAATSSLIRLFAPDESRERAPNVSKLGGISSSAAPMIAHTTISSIRVKPRSARTPSLLLARAVDDVVRRVGLTVRTRRPDGVVLALVAELVGVAPRIVR